MPIHRHLLRSTIFIAALSWPLFSQDQLKAPERDAQSIEILTRVAVAAGGSQTIAAVHDLTEKGDITFYWGKGVKGPLTIQMLGANHFRMEAALPDDKKVWTVRNGSGLKTEHERTIPMTQEGAINLENLTYPLAHVAAALADSTSEISFLGIEKREGRSVYRLRVRGQLGLATKGSQSKPVAKDLLIDALDFDIVSVEDRPFPNRADRLHDTPSRAIEYADFRVVKGLRLPFSIDTQLMGQKTLSISLSDAVFNSNLTDEDFRK